MIAVKWSFLSRLVIQNRGEKCSAVHSTLLYINSEAVIPSKTGIQLTNTGFPRIPTRVSVEGRSDKYGAG